MKKYFFTLIVTAYFLPGMSQSVFEDAIALRRYVKDGKFESISGEESYGYLRIILKQIYIPAEDVTKYNLKGNLSMHTYFDSIKPNPFLVDFFLEDGTASTDADPMVRTNTQAPLISSSGINFPVIADGIAKFLVERFKEEMSITFFDQFKDKLNSPELEELRTLFPNTTQVLNTINKDIYQFSAYLNMLRESFEKDLSAMPANMLNVLESPAFSELMQFNPKLQAAFSLGVHITRGLMDQNHPGDIIAGIDTAKIRPLGDDFTAAVVFGKEISSSFRWSDLRNGERYWAPADTVSKRFKDPVMLRLYLGLLYQRVKIQSDTLGLEHIMTSTDTKFYLETLTAFIRTAGKIEALLQKIKSTEEQEITYQQIYDYYSGTIDIVEQFKKICEKFVTHHELQWSKDFDLGIYIARTSGGIYLDVNEKKYASAILNSIALIDTVCQDRFIAQLYTDNHLTEEEIKDLDSNYKKELPSAVDDILKINHNPSHRIKSKKTEMDALFFAVTNTVIRRKIENLYRYNRLRSTTDLVQSILKYGNFMASVVQAKNSDEVKEIIKAIALPPGSSYAKTHTSFSIALNGYVGGLGGVELSRDTSAIFGSASIWAPVGVSFNWGLNNKYVGTLGIGLTIIDLGALVSFRFGDDTTSTDALPQFNARNLLAPGAYFTVGRLFNTPMTFSVGGQFGPQLRSISSTGADLVTDSWRISATISCDIPFFYLYRKPFKNKYPLLEREEKFKKKKN